MKKTNKIYTKKFTFCFADLTAEGAISFVPFDPNFDIVPSTKQPVNTDELAEQYCKELFGKQ